MMEDLVTQNLVEMLPTAQDSSAPVDKVDILTRYVLIVDR